VQGHEVLYGVHPEHFALDALHGLPAELVVVEPTGSETPIAARLAGQDIVAAFCEPIEARPGSWLALIPRAEHVHLFDAASGQRLGYGMASIWA
jgi:multiple sugar transport system ATP-binding protein